MFLEIGAPAFEVSIVAVIGCRCEDADNDITAAHSRIALLAKHAHLQRTVFLEAAATQDVIKPFLGTQKSKRAKPNIYLPLRKRANAFSVCPIGDTETPRFFRKTKPPDYKRCGIGKTSQ